MSLRRIALFAMSLFSASSPARSDAPTANDKERSEVASAEAAFGLRLFATVAPAGNTVFSPQSVFEALAMTSGGAAKGTLDAMRTALGVTLPEDRFHAAIAALRADRAKRAEFGFQLRVANRLFVHQSLDLDPAFVGLTRSRYDAELGKLDFVGAREAARKAINSWVAEQTNDRIQGLIQPPDLTPNTRLVLANAIWFKGDWRHKFEPTYTRDAPFIVNAKEVRNVRTMHQTLNVRYARAAGAQWLELPYGRTGGMTFVIGLPDAVDGLAALRKAITPEALASAMDKLATARVALALPKFKLDARFLLGDALTTLGMGVAFTQAADFTRITNPAHPADQLFIEKVIHQAFIDVNEKGTEAAAATAVMMGRKGAGPPAAPPIPFTVDHPFVFFLRDTTTGELLFAGQVSEPK